MKPISGFSLVRNGVNYDYPFLEAWRSILPIVDELVINVGKSEDHTLQLAKDFAEHEGHGKVRLFESEWPLNDPQKKREGLILSEQTNLALDACTNDWCFYIQADEVVHQDDHIKILNALKHATSHADERLQVEGIVFTYQHFYGSYNVVQNTRSAYRRELRMIRKSSGARSVGDAQSFRKPDGSKLRALLSPARIFHYGWVRTPDAMKEKTHFMDQLYHGNSSSEVPHTGSNHEYKRFWGLNEFKGTHPQVMENRIRTKGWNWDLKKSKFVFGAADFKKVVLDLYERITQHRPFEFKNYVIVDTTASNPLDPK